MVGTVSPTESNYYLNDVRGNTQVTARGAHTFGQLQLARDSAALGRYTKGRISQILLYDRELTPNEVMTNYRALKGRYFSIPQQNLILHLDAGDVNSYPGGGASWFEISGSGSTATLNSLTFTPTNGGGFIFNGSSSYATVPTASRFDLGTGSATIIAWFKLTSSGLNCIASKRNGTGFQLYSFSGKLYADGAGTAGKSSSQSVNTGKIFCGAVVYDRAASLMRLYLNGVEDGNIALASTTLTDVADVNIGRETLGGTAGDYFNGNIYQVQIYNKALSPKEMRENFELLRSRYGV
jgi:hypothetical protein